MKIKRSELSVENYTATDGKLLIRPLPHMKRTVETTEFELKETEEDEDPTKEEAEPEYVPVKVKSKAPYEMQLAEVIASAPNNKYKVGDVIVYSVKFVKEFDLFKEVFLVSEYDLFGIYSL